MNLQIGLYFCSILLTFLLSAFLAWYAWEHRQVPGSSAYARLALSECLLALTEILSVLSPSMDWALIWFQMRYIVGAFIAVFWFIFALEYSGRKGWLSKKLLAGLFFIPLVTQVLHWSNGLHGLWMKQDAGFTQIGPLWIADITSRLPGLGYLTHSFYTMFLTLAGIVLLFLTAWKMRREFIGQALLLAGGGLTALVFVINSLFSVLPKTEFNPFTSGIGLSVLLIALSVFRFEFLKRAPAQEDGLHVTRFNEQEKNSLAIFILIFTLFASGLAAVSYITYHSYEEQFRTQVENQLGSIAALKVNELQDWRNERLADANLFYKNENFSEHVRFFLENPQDADAQVRLLTWMKKIKASPEYDRVFLIDAQGHERISLPATPEVVPANLVEQVFASLDADQITFLDFHRHSDSDAIHLSMVVPVFNAQNHQSLGALVLRINPDVYLYPFIQRWPVPSQSAETLLVRREGDTSVFLNSLRFQPDMALTLNYPLTELELPSVKAVLGQTGIVEGEDYHGVQVIADIRAVENSPWFLVSKLDTAEVYAPLRDRLWQTILFFGALILATGAGLMLVWRQQRVNYYRAQAETAEILRKSEEKYHGLIEHASDGIFIADAGGKYLEVNPSGCAMLGYTRDEILSKHISELVAPEDIIATPLRLDELRQGKTVLSERRLICKDGSLLPVEISGCMLPDGRFLSITRDITERKQAGQALHSSEEKFRQAFDTSPIAISISRINGGRFVLVNKSFERFTGYAEAEVIGKSAEELNLWKSTKTHQALISDLRVKGEMRDYETTILTRHGEIFCLMSASIIEINGEPHILTMTVDITGRKHAEDALGRSQAQLQAIMDYSPALISIKDLDGNIILANRSFSMLDAPPLSELIGKNVFDIFPREVAEALWNNDLAALQANAPVRSEEVVKHKDGVWHTYWTVKFPIYLQSDQPFGICAISNDITELKHAEAQVRAQASRQKILADSSGAFATVAQNYEAVLDQVVRETVDVLADMCQVRLLSEDGKSLELAALYSLDREFSEALRSLEHDWSKSNDDPDFALHVVRSGEPAFVPKITVEQLRAFLPPEYWSISLRIVPHSYIVVPLSVQGHILGIMSMVRYRSEQPSFTREDLELIQDLANRAAMAINGARLFQQAQNELVERKQAQEQLLKTLDELKRSNAELEQFAYVASHDLQEPLRAVAGMVQLLQQRYKGQLDGRADEYIDLAVEGATRMQTLISDLLAYSRVERRGSPIKQTDANQALRSALRNLGTAILEQGATITHGDLPTLDADATQLTQLFQNLIGNAIKFCGERPPKIHVEALDIGDAWQFSVSDNGIGIEPQYYERIFLVFQRLHTRRDYPGTGIGLSICKKIVERHGGRIWVESVSGQGTTFHFTIPHRR